jgi:hypothetical protein
MFYLLLPREEIAARECKQQAGSFTSGTPIEKLRINEAIFACFLQRTWGYHSGKYDDYGLWCNRSHTIMSCANSSKLLLARCTGLVGLLSWSVVHLVLSQGVFWLAVNQERETTTLMLNETQLGNLNTYLLNCYSYIKVIGLHYYRNSKLIAERSAFVHLHKLYTIIKSSDKQPPTGSWLSVCCHLFWITLTVCSDFFLLNPSDSLIN